MNKNFSILFVAFINTIFIFCSLSVAQHHHGSESKPFKKQTNLKKVGSEYAQFITYTGLDVFWCPMDCEEGKTYKKKGTCPECEMNLKPKKARYLAIRLFSKDKKTPFQVKAKSIKVGLKAKKGKEYRYVTLNAKPLKGQKNGYSSNFSGATLFLEKPQTLTATAKIPFTPKDYRKVLFLKISGKIVSYPLNYCLIMTDEKINSKPLTIIYEDYEIKFCCKGCLVSDFNLAPEENLQKLKSAIAKKNKKSGHGGHGH